MKHGNMNWIFSLALVCALFLSACGAATTSSLSPTAGMVYEVSRVITYNGLVNVMAGTEGSMILRNGEQYVFVWSVPGRGMAFYLIDAVRLATINAKDARTVLGFQNAALASCTDTQCLITFLQDRGWVLTTAASLSQSLRSALTTVLSTAIRSFPTLVVMFVPATMEDIQNYFSPNPVTDL